MRSVVREASAPNGLTTAIAKVLNLSVGAIVSCGGQVIRSRAALFSSVFNVALLSGV